MNKLFWNTQFFYFFINLETNMQRYKLVSNVAMKAQRTLNLCNALSQLSRCVTKTVYTVYFTECFHIPYRWWSHFTTFKSTPKIHFFSVYYSNSALFNLICACVCVCVCASMCVLVWVWLSAYVCFLLFLCMCTCTLTNSPTPIMFLVKCWGPLKETWKIWNNNYFSLKLYHLSYPTPLFSISESVVTYLTDGSLISFPGHLPNSVQDWLQQHPGHQQQPKVIMLCWRVNHSNDITKQKSKQHNQTAETKADKTFSAV